MKRLILFHNTFIFSDIQWFKMAANRGEVGINGLNLFIF